MALVDGELEPHVAADVSRAVARHASLQLKLEIYHRTRAIVARSFGAIATEPVPERLTRTVVGRRN